MSEKRDPRFKNRNPLSKDISGYVREYGQLIQEGLSGVSSDSLEAAYELLEKTVAQGGHIYVAGNGGSSGIADHLCCDWMKGTYHSHFPTFRVQSMTAHIGLLTALANDFSYEEGFSRQVEMLAQPRDLVLLISSSGNSPNIIRAAEKARDKGVKILALCGFSGGKLKTLADVALHVPFENYGIVEDCHQMLMHCFAQLIAKKRDSAT